jgi:hypothetical protein
MERGIRRRRGWRLIFSDAISPTRRLPNGCEGAIAERGAALPLAPGGKIRRDKLRGRALKDLKSALVAGIFVRMPRDSRANINPWLIGAGITYRFGGPDTSVAARQ